jgi:hypothetical protein
LARGLAAAVEDNCLSAIKGWETLFVPTLGGGEVSTTSQRPRPERSLQGHWRTIHLQGFGC